jgi:catechol 2,3-dioxygenase-like lactoylglutathione lyase family enzyme
MPDAPLTTDPPLTTGPPLTTDASTARAVIDHAGVSVADLERSERFYRDVLGFTMAEDRFAFPEHDLRGVVLVNPQGARVELFERKDSVPTGPHHQIESTRQQGWFQFALAVPDIAGTFTAVVAAGAEPSLAPTTAPDGVSLVAFVRDPDGNLVEFLQRPGSPGPPG